MDAVDVPVESGALDALFAKIDAGEVELTGGGGVIPGLKATLERGLVAELTDHLGSDVLRFRSQQDRGEAVPLLHPLPARQQVPVDRVGGKERGCERGHMAPGMSAITSLSTTSMVATESGSAAKTTVSAAPTPSPALTSGRVDGWS